MPKLLQAKQAADLHTPGFNQRIVHEVIRDGFLDRHVPTIRALYKAQRDAMLAALERHMPDGRALEPAGRRHVPLGRACPQSMNAVELLPLRRRARRGLRARRTVLCRRAAGEHAAPVVRDRERERRSRPASRRLARRSARHRRTRHDDESPPLPSDRRLHRASPTAATRSPSCSTATALSDDADAALRALDEPVRDDLPAAADRPGGRLPRAHLHPRRRAAVRRPSDARHLPRLARRRRHAAERGRDRAAMRRRPRAHAARRVHRLAFEAPPLRRSGARSGAASPQVLAALGVDADATARGAVARQRAAMARRCCSTARRPCSRSSPTTPR